MVSAGSFIALAGDEIRMAKNAYMMIHNAWGGVMGNAIDLRRYAEMLAKIDGNIVREGDILLYENRLPDTYLELA